ncbi:MAG: hypothetical protein KDA31_12270 [Phycisphaerales bacterium]|nr:hypothetical protein [Phycisphaerales bacterium]
MSAGIPKSTDGAAVTIRALLNAALVALCLLTTPAKADPQDGPHADLRISVTDKDVRYVLGMNLNYVDAVAPTQREFGDVVDPSEEEAVRDAILHFLLDQNSVTIDGVPVRGVIENYELIRLGRENLKLFPKTGMRALTRFDVVVSYPFKTPPEHVAMTWSDFPEDTLSAEMEGADGKRPKLILLALVKAEGVVEQVIFSESDPTVDWHPSHMTIDDRLAKVPAPTSFKRSMLPVASLGVMAFALGVIGIVWARTKKFARAVFLIGLPAAVVAIATRDLGLVPLSEADVSDEQLLDVFRPLHANVYRAFDYSAESDIYDALSRSVSGPMLEELYTQIHRGLIQAENGGSVGRVTRVDLDEAKVVGFHPEGTPSFEVEAYWLVEGTVYHWGHSHPRETVYHAKYTVAVDDGKWRIVASDVLSSVNRDPSNTGLPPPGETL